MATLEQVGELVTTQLQDRVDRLVSAIEEDAPDFGEVADLADAVGELADQTAAIYFDLEQTLVRRLHGDGTAEEDDDGPRRNRRTSRRRTPRQQRSGQNGATVEDVTKEELLERARGANVHGRSSMSKEELAQAVEAEEGKTKEELLERAREADIEGRSAMTKESLRQALNEADA